MRKILILFALLLSFTAPLRSQSLTTVTATVTDSAGTAYSFGSYTVNLVNTTNQQPLFGGNATFQQVYSGGLDTNGALSISLPSVTVMTPSPGLQWKFFICANPLQIAAVFPKPTLPCFTYTSTGTQISGSSVDLSSSMTAVATVIPKTGQGGSGTFTAITAGTIIAGNENGVLWVDGTTYTTCAAAITAAGSVNKTIIAIPSTYAGAECPTQTSLDGEQNIVTTPNITIWDFRGGTVGHNADWNSSAQDANNNIQSRLSIMNYQSALAATKTSSAIVGTNFLTGTGPTPSFAGITGEVVTTGALTPGAGVILGVEGYAAIRSTGGTQNDVRGGTFSVNLDRSASTTNVTTATGLFANKCTNVSSTATITNCYSLHSAWPGTVATSRNYSYHQDGIGVYGFISAVGSGMDAEDSGGVARALLRVDTSNNVILSAINTSGLHFRYNDGVDRFSVEDANGVRVKSSSAGSGQKLIMQDIGGTSVNWLFGCQFNQSGACEFTPSTAVGGFTFSTPVWTVNQQGGQVPANFPLQYVCGTNPSGQSNETLEYCNSTDKTMHYNANSGGDSAFTGAWQCTNVTPVTTSGGAVTTDQNMMACTIPAGTLNRVGRTLRVKVAGVYSTPAASVSQMTLKVKICSVSGCGSGNVLTALSIQSTALGTVQITNDNFSLRGELTTQTAGATLAEEAHGEYLIDLATLATAADNVFGDGNTATQTGTPSAIDSTAQNFLQVTFAFSAASASNVATQRQLIAETVN